MASVFTWGVKPEQVVAFFQEAAEFCFVPERTSIPILLGQHGRLSFDLKPGFHFKNYEKKYVSGGRVEDRYNSEQYRMVPISAFLAIRLKSGSGHITFTLDPPTGTFVVTVQPEGLARSKKRLLEKHVGKPLGEWEELD